MGPFRTMPRIKKHSILVIYAIQSIENDLMANVAGLK
jgi:hypothetical protein